MIRLIATDFAQKARNSEISITHGTGDSSRLHILSTFGSERFCHISKRVGTCPESRKCQGRRRKNPMLAAQDISAALRMRILSTMAPSLTLRQGLLPPPCALTGRPPRQVRTPRSRAIAPLAAQPSSSDNTDSDADAGRSIPADQRAFLDDEFASDPRLDLAANSWPRIVLDEVKQTRDYPSREPPRAPAEKAKSREAFLLRLATLGFAVHPPPILLPPHITCCVRGAQICGPCALLLMHAHTGTCAPATNAGIDRIILRYTTYVPPKFLP